MGFVLERKEMRNTSDALEAMLGTLLMVTGIAYDELIANDMKYFDSRLEMLEAGISSVKYARQLQLKESGISDVTAYVNTEVKEMLEKAYLDGVGDGKLSVAMQYAEAIKSIK